MLVLQMVPPGSVTANAEGTVEVRMDVRASERFFEDLVIRLYVGERGCHVHVHGDTMNIQVPRRVDIVVAADLGGRNALLVRPRLEKKSAHVTRSCLVEPHNRTRGLPL